MAKHLEVVDVDAAPPVWAALRNEAAHMASQEPSLASVLNAVVIRHSQFSSALSYQLARKLGDQELRAMSLRETGRGGLCGRSDHHREGRGRPAGRVRARPGLQGLCAALPVLQGLPGAADPPAWPTGCGGRAARPWPSICRAGSSELFQVDIHPATTIGRGVFFDHGTGIVIGETAVVGDDVSMLQGVTLGGTGAERGDRHPKIGKGVLLGAGRQGAGQHHHRRLRQDRLGLGGAEARAARAAPPPACRRAWSTARPARSRPAPWTTPSPTRSTTT